MADPDLSYNTVVLDTLASRLSTIHSNLADDSALKDYGRHDVASHRVADAIGDFVNDWDDKRKKLNGKVEALAAMAGEAAEKFTEADLKLAASLQSEE